MRITVYIPQTFKISENDVRSLTEAARRRHNIPADKPVSARHIIEEARRAGIIELGRDYCIDLDSPASIRRRHRGNGNGTRPRRRPGRAAERAIKG